MKASWENEETKNWYDVFTFGNITVANALAQIEEKQYEAELLANGIASENIRKYGFAFEGKKCLIG